MGSKFEEATISEETADNPGVIAFPPALFAGTLAIGLLLQLIFPVSFLPQFIAIALGVIVLIGAALIAISAFRAMHRAQTAVDPAQPTTAQYLRYKARVRRWV